VGPDSVPNAAVIARSVNSEAIQFLPGLKALDCFVEPVIGPAKPDPLARNDGEACTFPLAKRCEARMFAARAGLTFPEGLV
jgi:hypothetical protein